MEESCFCFWKSKTNSTFCKVVKQKGEGKPTFSTRSFPLSLFIYPKLCSFGLLLKMRCIFYAVLLWHGASFWQPLQPWFVKETAVFLCKGTKLKIVMPVFCGTELWGPKPVIPTNVLAPKPPCLVQTPCAKTAKSCAFCDCTPEFYGGILYWLLEKQGKLYFLQSSQTKGRGVLLRLVTPVLSAAVCKSSRIRRSRILGLYAGFLFYQRLVPKLQIVCRFSPWNVFPPMKPAF